MVIKITVGAEKMYGASLFDMPFFIEYPPMHLNARPPEKHRMYAGPAGHFCHLAYFIYPPSTIIFLTGSLISSIAAFASFAPVIT